MKRFSRIEFISRLLLSALATCTILLEEGVETWAQAPAGKSPQPGSVDLNLSRVIMWVGKTGLGHEHAIMGSLKSGQILLGAASNAGTLVFDMTTFNADGPDARKYVGLKGETDVNTRRQVNENMHNASLLNSGAYPAATFQIDSALPS